MFTKIIFILGFADKVILNTLESQLNFEQRI